MHKEIVNEITNKVKTAEQKSNDMTDKVEVIDEEYAVLLEEHQKALHELANFPTFDQSKRLEGKIKVLKEVNENIIDKLGDMTSQIFTNE